MNTYTLVVIMFRFSLILRQLLGCLETTWCEAVDNQNVYCAVLILCYTIINDYLNYKQLRYHKKHQKAMIKKQKILTIKSC